MIDPANPEHDPRPGEPGGRPDRRMHLVVLVLVISIVLGVVAMRRIDAAHASRAMGSRLVARTTASR